MPTATQSIREIVTRQPSAARIFHRFDIDLCLQADLSLEGACQELQLSVDQVLEKLADAEAKERGGAALDPATLSLGTPDPTHRPRSSPSCSSRASEARRDGFEGRGEAQ